MRQHSINRTIRFFLEFAALAAIAMWGMQQDEGGLRYLWAIGLPLFAAGIWMAFRAEDHRRPARVRVPGLVRLALELLLFGFSVWAISDIGATTLSWIFGILVALHYAISYDRVLRLLRS